ncbi:hypothetical protein [Parasulfitobacter algicola]|uniref:Secreted protein n=1 Tax=Parasulfitobacter algicola TaxID=2614809 RepID=A0ABX2ITY6_9RHOB|nr:hypothetical protein [Sulfitobacter algicola]NSX56369.1 hypothetical protein [Sulfitobacter algicola]
MDMIFFIALGAVISFVIWKIIKTRRCVKPVQTHRPHSPGPGYDQATIAQSKTAGNTASGDSAGGHGV